MNNEIKIPTWAAILAAIALALIILAFFGAFDSKQIETVKSEKAAQAREIDTLIKNRDSTISQASKASTGSSDAATSLIKQLPNEKFNIIRDTTDDWMYRKITE